MTDTEKNKSKTSGPRPPKKDGQASWELEAEALLQRTILCSPHGGGLPPEALKSLSSVARKKAFRAGELVFSRGDPLTGFYLVSQGKVRIFVSDHSGKERTIKIAEPGEFFGEAALFQKDGYPASSSAITKSQAFYFSKADALRLMAENPGLAFATMDIMAERLSHFASLMEGGLKKTGPRLAQYLLELPEKDGLVRLPVKKAELASHLGVTPESISRALRDMKARGLVSEEKSRMAILRRDLLERLAEET